MNVFDIVGPIMVGPSSSHTAGAVRIGRFAYNLLQEPAVKAEMHLHGSFAKTYRGHGSDKALVAGVMGMDTDDEGIVTSLELARKRGLEVVFKKAFFPDVHPNTVLVNLTGQSGRQVSVLGESIGGGSIRITQINGLKVQLSGSYDTLVVVHTDTPGVVASVTQYISRKGVNVSNIHLSRDERGGTAIMSLEADGQLSHHISQHIGGQANVLQAVYIPRL